MGTSMRYRFVVLGLALEELAEAQKPCVLLGRQIGPTDGQQSAYGPLIVYVSDDIFESGDDLRSPELREYLVHFINEVEFLPVKDIPNVFSRLEKLSVGPLRCMEVGECTFDELPLRLEQVFNAKYRQACVTGS